MEYNKDSLYTYLLYSQPIPYNDVLTFYPVKMKDYLKFQVLAQCVQVRKDSWFGDKKTIKMGYGEFLWDIMTRRPELAKQVKKEWLVNCYIYFLSLLALCCELDAKDLAYNTVTGAIQIKDYTLTETDIDNIRRIIILQNGIDFDVDEFINRDTEEALKKAKKANNKTEDKATLEDYIDSAMVALHYSEREIAEMPVRKFWRLIERLNLHENYIIMRTGECSGMVTFKDPIKHWMVELDNGDKYKDAKADETALHNKINGANG